MINPVATILVRSRRCSAIGVRAIFFAAALAAGPARADDTQVLVVSLLNDIRDSLIRVNAESGGKLALEKATLTLQTIASTEAGGKVSLFVVSFGAKISTESTQVLKVELSPPTSADHLPASATSDALAQAIVSAYRAVNGAENGIPPLRMRKMSADIKFVVAAGANAGGGFRLLPVTIDLSGEVIASNVQEISLTFCKTPCAQ
jgi:hypothetical protein